MNIYSKHRTTSKIHRSIYIKHYGAIPKEPNGRSYEIHHIDGNHTNNDPSNLVAVTLQEHYDIHFQQGDFNACTLLALKLSKSPEEISLLNSLAAKKRIANGTHPFLGENNPSIKRMKDGTHQFLDSQWQRKQSKKRVENGTHNFLGGAVQHARLDNGTHHFLGDTNPSMVKSKDGTHSWFGGEHHRNLHKRLKDEGRHPNQFAWTCECCGKTGKGKSNLSQHTNKWCPRIV